MTTTAFSDIFLTAHDGLRLHVRDYGKPWPGTLPVVCLPGLTRTAADFDTLATALSQHPVTPRRVLALDYRGRGQSAYDPNPANYALPVELTDVMTVTAALAVEPAIYIGTSRGGILTMVLAKVKPQAIAGAVLNDIGPVVEPAGLMRIKGYVGRSPPVSSFDDAAAGLRRMFGDQFPHLTAADWLAWAHRAFKRDGGRLMPTYDLALARTLESFTPETPMPDLWQEFDLLAGVPAMAVHGALSDLLSAATVTAMAARHPALDVVTIPDQGHAPLLVEPDIVGRIVSFASRCDAARTSGSAAS